ncbi:hypothetical protein [Microbacterium immunditiarum]|uniref:Type VI protein secretion system component VasK n=1 Tax=Microbacterium immunditiarum TaxID=337480 RepID=A0A7Y9GLW8_9MICO|nr:hypothetical protein [Microbacterium immunditiarum]NYE18854.1 type VI protein secretion system component VasK [Microbacterium immunditiarum]
MVYEERNTWSSLVVTLIAMIVYVVVVLQAAGGGPLTDVDWWPIMLWTIAGAIVVTIVVSILWGMLAGMRDPDEVGKSDQRDRDIARMGERVGTAFLVLGGLAVIVLCAFEADWFWIANAMFFGFAISNIVGAIARVVAYRRGLA